MLASGANCVSALLCEMQNLKNVRMPQGNAPGRLAGLIIGGGALLYGVSNSLFNVEGGHRAIVFNRVTGIKEQVGHGRHVDIAYESAAN